MKKTKYSRNVSEELKKVGDYLPYQQEKGVMESCCVDNIKEGEDFWTIRLDKDGMYHDTKSQDTVVILNKLVKIEQMLKKLKNDKSNKFTKKSKKISKIKL